MNPNTFIIYPFESSNGLTEYACEPVVFFEQDEELDERVAWTPHALTVTQEPLCVRHLVVGGDHGARHRETLRLAKQFWGAPRERKHDGCRVTTPPPDVNNAFETRTIHTPECLEDMLLVS